MLTRKYTNIAVEWRVDTDLFLAEVHTTQNSRLQKVIKFSFKALPTIMSVADIMFTHSDELTDEKKI